jgi:hypothetical protein
MGLPDGKPLLFLWFSRRQSWSVPLQFIHSQSLIMAVITLPQ